MMTQNELHYYGDKLNDLLDVLDSLHTAASENQLQTYTTISEGDLLGLLQELIYTAQETIEEIQANQPRRTQRKKGAMILQLINETNRTSQAQ
ncbi:MAG: hypothetical protein MUF87_13100 [Anaerolineae bacterium]|nr:hypothetical protein [Anaerolineae bacterium]